MFKYSYEKLMGISGIPLLAALIVDKMGAADGFGWTLLGVSLGFMLASVFCFYQEECK
jgi:hypothetical protein